MAAINTQRDTSAVEKKPFEEGYRSFLFSELRLEEKLLTPSG